MVGHYSTSARLSDLYKTFTNIPNKKTTTIENG